MKRRLCFLAVAALVIATGCGKGTAGPVAGENKPVQEEQKTNTVETPNVTPTETPTPTDAPKPTDTPKPTFTPAPTNTPTNTPKITITPTPKIVETELGPKTVVRRLDGIVAPAEAAAPSGTATRADAVSISQSELSEAVNTSSFYTSPYSDRKETKNRTPLYFFHPRKLILTDEKAEALLWVSSDPSVIRVYSDGAVEAYKEGIADVTAYDKNGKAIETFFLYATTSNDADPVGSMVDYSDTEALRLAYSEIEFQDIQESINNITDYVSYLMVNNCSYNMAEEGTSPRPMIQNDIQWIQGVNSDWIFKNRCGICYNVCAGALYSLVGDYERSGIIQMAGQYGHTVYWCYENGTYYVYDFTNIISSGYRPVYEEFAGNVYLYVDSTLGRGTTLLEAFKQCADKSDTFYFKNNLIYSVDLTGIDYYPAEANNYMSDGDFSKLCKVYFIEGTVVEKLFTAEGTELEFVYLKREEIPVNMRVNTPAGNTENTHTDTNLGRLIGIRGTGKADAPDLKISVDKEAKTYRQDDLKTVVDSSSSVASSYLKTAGSGRTIVYLYETARLENIPANTAYWLSSDANVVRVLSDGTLKPYSEGNATIYGFDANGHATVTVEVSATTRADADPFADTVGSGDGSIKGYDSDFTMQGKNSLPEALNPIQKINFEDIKDEIKTITDYAEWLYANYVYYSADEEIKGPYVGVERYPEYESDEMWYPAANSDNVFTDFTGVCWNFAAGALYSLQGDYEANGLIMMSGNMGHTINWFYENGSYYVLDYTGLVGDRYVITDGYDSNPRKYVLEHFGSGNTIKEALDDLISKHPDMVWYYENGFLYATDSTGFDFYQGESNSWSERGLARKSEGTNILYSPEYNKVSLLWVGSDYTWDYNIIGMDMVPGSLQVIYSKDVTAGLRPSAQLGVFDNKLVTVEEYRKLVGKLTFSKAPAAVRKFTEHSMIYNVYRDEGYAVYRGITDNTDYPTEIVIKDTYDGYPVTVIDQCALLGKGKIYKLTIPASVTEIREQALDRTNPGLVIYVYKGSYAEEYCKANKRTYKIVK